MRLDFDDFMQRIERTCSPEFCQWARERVAVPFHQDIGSAYQAMVAAAVEAEWLIDDENKLTTLEIMEKVSRVDAEREVRALTGLLAL